MYSNKYDEQEVPFGYTGIPLSQIVALFYPFFIKYITDFVEIHKDAFSNVGPKQGIYIDDVDEQFSDKSINSLLDNYIRDLGGRFDRLRVKNKADGKYYPVKIFNEDLGRDFTITDLLYIAAIDICEDKHVYVTRYPVGNFLNIYPSKISILSTSQTTNIKIENRILKNYPVIYPDYPVKDYTFVDSTRINTSYVMALGADTYKPMNFHRSIPTIHNL